MKNFYFIISLILFSCSNVTKQDPKKKVSIEQTEQIRKDFQTLLDSAGVKGSILIWTDNSYFSNDFKWAKKGQIPASTFKIPNSIIALDLGIIENEETIIKWDGKPRFLKSWEQDLTFKEAFHHSCVPCYQEIARKIGERRMKNYLEKFSYGNMKFDSTSLDVFWLEGESKINQYQQINFLKTFNEQRLPISKRTHKLMRKMMIIEQNNTFTLRGKTGWSVSKNKDNCWFVGFVETKQDYYYFATNIEPVENLDYDKLKELRKVVTMKALEKLGAFK